MDINQIKVIMAQEDYNRMYIKTVRDMFNKFLFVVLILNRPIVCSSDSFKSSKCDRNFQ